MSVMEVFNPFATSKDGSVFGEFQFVSLLMILKSKTVRRRMILWTEQEID